MSRKIKSLIEWFGHFFIYNDAQVLYADISSKPFEVESEWYQLALLDKGTDKLISDLAVHFVELQFAEIGFTGKGTAKR